MPSGTRNQKPSDHAPRRSTWWREVFGSLRFRLTLWSTIVMLGTIVVTLFTVRETLRVVLETEIDQLLAEDAREAVLTVEEFYPDFERIQRELARKADTHEHYGLFLRVLDPSGRLVWQSDSVPAQFKHSARVLFNTAPRTIGSYRIRRRDSQRETMPAYTVCAGASLEMVASDVRELTKILASIGGILMLIVPVGGFWLAGRATRPLAQIIDTTARLHPRQLDERLPLRGTRDELDRLSTTINGLLDRIAKYLEQNRRFTADAAHELRSPLTAMRSALDVALSTARTTAEYQEILADTLEECEALSRLVNQLLLLAENDAGFFEVGSEPMALDRLITRAVEMFLPVAEAREIQLTTATLDPVQVLGDAGRLRQVVNNLIDNALKFSAPGGEVTIELIGNLPTGFATLSVSDTGAGIEPADLARIFERFYRADKSRQRVQRTGGTGLGLSICHSIVTAHRGTIRAASTPGAGTTITVELPLAPPETVRLPAPASAVAHGE